MDGDLEINGLTIKTGNKELSSVDVKVPSDTSGSAFWLVAGACHPDSKITIPGMGMNPKQPPGIPTVPWVKPRYARRWSDITIIKF